MLSFYLSLVLTEEDRDKVTELYINYYPVMLYVAEQKLGKRKELASDIVHDAMLKIIDKLNLLDLSDEKKARNLCITIVKNGCCDYLRSKNSNVESLDDYHSVESELYPDEIIVSEENIDKIVDAIEALDEKYVYISRMKFVYGYTEKEISEILKINYSTVRTRIERSKQKLKMVLMGNENYD